MSELCLDRRFIAERLPHGQSMSLLDRVVRWDEESIHCISRRHATDDHPLRGARGLHAVHAIEYAAQAAAVHGALTAGGGPARSGMIAGVRDVHWEVERLDAAEPLHVRCAVVVREPSAVVYRFELCLGETPVAGGCVTVAFPGSGS